MDARASRGQTRERAFLTEGTATAEGLVWLKNQKITWLSRAEGSIMGVEDGEMDKDSVV